MLFSAFSAALSAPPRPLRLRVEPILRLEDRGPAIAVGVAMALIGGLVLAEILFLG